MATVDDGRLGESERRTLDERLALLGVLQELTVASIGLADPESNIDDFLQVVAARLGCVVALCIELNQDGTRRHTVVGAAGVSRRSRAIELPALEENESLVTMPLRYPELATRQLQRWVIDMRGDADSASPPSWSLLLLFEGSAMPPPSYERLMQRVAVQIRMALDHRRLVQRLVERERSSRVLTSRLRALVDHVPHAIVAEDEQRKITHANQALCDMFALPEPPESLIGTSLATRVVSYQALFADPASARRRFEEVASSSTSVLGEALEMADGRVLERDYVPLFVDGARVGCLWTYHDITSARRRTEEIRRLNEELEIRVEARTAQLETANLELAASLATLTDMQNRLVETGKLAAVGQLAAGVAHEINNPLAYVHGNLDVLGEELDALVPCIEKSKHRELRKMIDDATDGAVRIEKIVRGLGTFARVEKERRTPVHLWRVLDVAIDMSFNEIRHRAQLLREPGPVPLVDADETRLCQVFINLLVNAAQAIQEGHADRNQICVRTTTDRAGRAVVEIRDTGPGISAEVQARMFEPFFTTKAIGKGTGLGLSICYGIVSSHGGDLQVESLAGRGTIFRVVLPASVGVEERPSRGPSARPEPCRRSRVLVVDDDALVGEVIRRVLRQQDVTLVRSGVAALEYLRNAPAPDVIFCDLMMPEMSGMELHAKVAEQWPELNERMIFMTGGAFTPAAYEFLASIPNNRVDKPFSAADLRAALDEALDVGVLPSASPTPKDANV